MKKRKNRNHNIIYCRIYVILFVICYFILFLQHEILLYITYNSFITYNVQIISYRYIIKIKINYDVTIEF